MSLEGGREAALELRVEALAEALRRGKWAEARGG
jgi:hypothetical protein